MIWQWFDCALLTIWIFRGNSLKSIFSKITKHEHCIKSTLISYISILHFNLEKNALLFILPSFCTIPASAPFT